MFTTTVYEEDSKTCKQNFKCAPKKAITTYKILCKLWKIAVFSLGHSTGEIFATGKLYLFTKKYGFLQNLTSSK